ncbi:MAG: zinc-dependent alcohol dehydrogenase [Desulfobacterales bacterium]
MKKIIIDKPKVFKTEIVPKPSVQNREVLIKVSRISLCGSDVHIYNGTYSGPITYPIMFGHEWSGVVEETGENVTKFKSGDRVTGDCSCYCSDCEYCQVDKNLCVNIEKFGITIEGASAEYIVRDEKYIYKLAENVPLKLGALVEPIAVGANLIEKVIKQKGDIANKKILVFGAGGIGMGLLFLLINRYGCRNIYVRDLSELKMEMAQEWGARPFDLTKVNISQNNYKSLYTNAEFDVVFETTGSAEIFASALRLLKPLGVLACLGMIPVVEINQKLMIIKSLSLIGSIGGTGYFDEVIDVLSKYGKSVEKLISVEYPADIDGVADTFKAAQNPSKTVKAQLVFS